MFYSDDPIRDYQRYDAEVQAKLSRLPKCEDCGNHLSDEEYFDVDGTILCVDCMYDRYRKYTEDYTE